MENNSIMITSESLHPLVDKHFENITSAQWSLLAAGAWDSDTEDTLTDLLTEIVQTLSADILKIVIPMFQERLFGNESEKNIVQAMEEVNLTLCLGDSIPESFAAALQVPAEKCESAEKLTGLVESEVLQKVASVLSVAINSKSWPEDPVVFVPASISKMSILRRMLTHATECLKRFVNRHFFGRYAYGEISSYISNRSQSLNEEEEERCASAPSRTSRISVLSATKAVSEILEKWSDEKQEVTEDVEKATTPPDTSRDAEIAAHEIVHQIMEDNRDMDFEAACSVVGSPVKRHLNMLSIHNMVKDFFSSRVKHPKEEKKEDVREQFHKVIAKQFQKMKKELRSTFGKKDSSFVVSLKQVSKSSKHQEEDGAVGVALPGEIPDPKTPKPKRRNRLQMDNVEMISVRKQNFSPIDYESIKSDVDRLFYQVNSQNTVDSESEIISGSDIKIFSRELTVMMYDHLVRSQTYRLPMAAPGKCLSDSVISQARGKFDFQTSPGVLYVMTEDAVRKFLQKIVMQLEMDAEELNQLMSIPLTDIENAIKLLKHAPEESSYRQSVVPSDASQRSENSVASSNFSSWHNCSHVKLHFETFSSNPTSPETPSSDPTSPETPSSDPTSSQKSSPSCPGSSLFLSTSVTGSPQIPSKPTSDPNVCPPPPPNTPRVMPAPNNNQSAVNARMAINLIRAMIIKLHSKALRGYRLSLKTDHLNDLLERLSNKVLNDIDVLPVSRIKSRKKFLKDMLEDLNKEFGSPGETLMAAIHEEYHFDEVFLNYLKIRLSAPQNVPKQSKVVRFFRALGRALTRPFVECLT
ncbi:uncharacterized protein LOC117829667 isoform X2 [Notolabrus celidotus]|uniref:uncharacterized protein LOC117829667 isoform X2 n=1 Tax=Notolabrus celidotus TaxID=1203425 RepID=UPI00148FACF3|nr:uncharacterized protein LOC117829667 isoform X2 [Notolabrus celidotus]